MECEVQVIIMASNETEGGKVSPTHRCKDKLFITDGDHQITATHVGLNGICRRDLNIKKLKFLSEEQGIMLLMTDDDDVNVL